MGSPHLRFLTFLAPNMFPVYQYIADYVGKKLGCTTEIAVGESFDQFAAGEADAGFICGLPYVRLADQPEPPVELLAAPVLQGERYAGKPVYFSDVIVHVDSPFQTFADLRGRSWSYNEPASHSGYNVTCHRLATIGATRDFFGKVIQAGFHQKSIRMVCTGEIDASAIDSQVLAIELRDHPELAPQLRIIDTFGPSPIQPVVASSRVPDKVKADLRAVLLEMGDDPEAKKVFAHGFVERFAPVTDKSYDDIREMTRLAESVSLV
jgi:phosphonate transport system substrate-binding protein